MHIVTVNDYLAKRDADWMRPIYEFLGLTVGVNLHGSHKMKNKQLMLQILLTVPIMNLVLIICAIIWHLALEDKVQRDIELCHCR